MMRVRIFTVIGSAALVAASASAVEIDVEIFGTIDDPASSGLEAGDTVQAGFTYESSVAESTTGNFPNAAFNLFVLLIDESEGTAIDSFVNQPDGDLFIGSDEFDLYYGPDAGQLGDNFGITLRGSTTPFGQNLETATTALTNAGDPLTLFLGDSDGFLQNDDTFEELFFTIDFITFTVVPEPASLALLGGLGLLAAGRRRR